MNVERKPVAPIEHFRSVRSTARKLPVGFYERSVCQQRLNVATWWKAAGPLLGGDRRQNHGITC